MFNRHNRRNLHENQYQVDKWDNAYSVLTIDQHIQYERDAYRVNVEHHLDDRIHTNILYIFLQWNYFVCYTYKIKYEHLYVLDSHQYFLHYLNHLIVLPYVIILRQHVQHVPYLKMDDDDDIDENDDYVKEVDFEMDEIIMV